MPRISTIQAVFQAYVVLKFGLTAPFGLRMLRIPLEMALKFLSFAGAGSPFKAPDAHHELHEDAAGSFAGLPQICS